VPADKRVVAGVANYPDEICVAVSSANIFAVQFHPEKSADAGLRVLKNFSTWNGTL
jgi:imidazole glycerol-phosphate synthase subunit HisH